MNKVECDKWIPTLNKRENKLIFFSDRQTNKAFSDTVPNRRYWDEAYTAYI